MSLSDFQFALPGELIAQVPVARRDDARLMVFNRRDGTLAHTYVWALAEHLRPGDLLVINDSKVIPARLFARTRTGGAAEVLLIRPQPPAGEHSDSAADPSTGARWLCLGKPARRLRADATLQFAENARATVAAVHGDGRYSILFDGGVDVAGLLARCGEVPLPPYIRRPDGPLPLDQTRYQTVFAAAPGAIAAPTAGLHFTDTLLDAVRSRGVQIAPLTLHVGPGTFLPVRTEDVQHHVMEPEWCDIPAATAAAIRRVKSAGGRVVAVGTTTTRALESAACAHSVVTAGARWAAGFIIPGYRFRVVDGLFTNFHLPGSTLLLLVSAFAGREQILSAYADAIRRRYRFYSYGDAMLIV